MKIKICGLFTDEAIDFVNEAKPDYAGFVLNYPKIRRNISLYNADFATKRKLRGNCEDFDEN